MEDGRILLNNENVKDYRLADLRSLLGYVPQRSVSICNKYFRKYPLWTSQFGKEIEVAKIVHVYDDIMDMPEKI